MIETIYYTLLLSFVIFVPLSFLGLLGALVGAKNNAKGEGFLLGFLLGPLGILIAAFLDCRRCCPDCGTRLNGDPRYCPQCGIALNSTNKSTPGAPVTRHLPDKINLPNPTETIDQPHSIEAPPIIVPRPTRRF
jgi:hypothetical protein